MSPITLSRPYPPYSTVHALNFLPRAISHDESCTLSPVVWYARASLRSWTSQFSHKIFEFLAHIFSQPTIVYGIWSLEEQRRDRKCDGRSCSCSSYSNILPSSLVDDHPMIHLHMPISSGSSSIIILVCRQCYLRGNLSN
jgi:hypothetical protein